MDQIENKWFTEKSDAWGIYGQCSGLTLKVTEILHHEKTPFQDILVFTNEFWGTVLVLDGVIQLTTRDEFAYQEMIAHLPLMAHPNPKSVFIVGGGDGGVVREVCRHKGVEKIHICEIDERVIANARKYLPTLSCCYDDPRVTIYNRDAFEMLKEVAAAGTEKYDVIISDSTDPVGFAATLFEESFFGLCHSALTDTGILSTQAESIWHQGDLLESMSKWLGNVFKSKEYAWITIPTYPCGNIGFWILSKGGNTCVNPRKADKEFEDSVKYWTPEIHTASFNLPAFGRRKIFGK
jgi:spermidine synthase